MKKIFYILFATLLLIPTIVFAEEKEVKSMEKFYADDTYEYYFYGQKSSEVIILADGYPEKSVEQALKDGESISKIKGLTATKIYQRKLNSKDLIVSDNVIKYSVLKDDKLTDYYLYLEELKPEDIYCDKDKTICFDIKNKTLTLNNFNGESIYISNVNIDSDDKADEIKMILKGNNTIINKIEDQAIYVEDNTLSIEGDKGDVTFSSSSSFLNIDAKSVGLYGNNCNLNIKNAQLNIVSQIKVDDTYYGMILDTGILNLDNVTLNINIKKKNENDTIPSIGTAVALFDTPTNIKNSFISIDTSLLGLVTGSMDEEKKMDFNLDESTQLYLNLSQKETKMDSIAVELMNLNFVNKGYIYIDDDKESLVGLAMLNTNFQNENVFILNTNAINVAFYAIDSNLSMNGNIFNVKNTREEKDNDVSSIFLNNSKFEISDKLKKNPKEFKINNEACILSELEKCEGTKALYEDNEILLVSLHDKLENKETGISVSNSEKFEYGYYLDVIDDTTIDKEWLNAYKKNLGKSSLLKMYSIAIIDELDLYELPNGTYQVYLPIPSDISKYNPVKVFVVNDEQKNNAKELKFKQSDDGKYYIVELTKANFEQILTLSIVGDEVHQVGTGRAIIGTTIFALIGGFACVMYKTKKKKKMFSI